MYLFNWIYIPLFFSHQHSRLLVVKWYDNDDDDGEDDDDEDDDDDDDDDNDDDGDSLPLNWDPHLYFYFFLSILKIMMTFASSLCNYIHYATNPCVLCFHITLDSFLFLLPSFQFTAANYLCPD